MPDIVTSPREPNRMRHGFWSVHDGAKVLLRLMRSYTGTAMTPRNENGPSESIPIRMAKPTRTNSTKPGNLAYLLGECAWSRFWLRPEQTEPSHRERHHFLAWGNWPGSTDQVPGPGMVTVAPTGAHDEQPAVGAQPGEHGGSQTGTQAGYAGAFSPRNRQDSHPAADANTSRIVVTPNNLRITRSLLNRLAIAE